MSKLSKTKSGLLFYDDFSERTLMWSLSPSDAKCLEYTENGLRILHNRQYVTFTIVEPALEEYSCIVKLDHIPHNFDDIAGVVVISSTKEYAECQTFLATGPSGMDNSGTINDDIKTYVHEVMAANENVVLWSENDNEPSSIQRPNTGSTEDHEDTPVKDNTYVDTLYKYIKVMKQKYKYTFWASEDSRKWIDVGNVKFDDSGVIGFFLYGTTDEDLINNSHCYFKSMAIYNSRYITIDGIDRKHEIEIYDENGTILIRSDNRAYYHMFNRLSTRFVIYTFDMPMPIKNAKLRIFEKGDYESVIGEYFLGEEMYGGDGFTFERNIKVFINGREILTHELFNLGMFFRGNYFIKADIRNCEDYVVDAKIKVVRYSEYYGGEQEVEIALYNQSKMEQDLDYQKELDIQIRPSETESIFIRLANRPDQMPYTAANDYRFKIMIE